MVANPVVASELLQVEYLDSLILARGSVVITEADYMSILRAVWEEG